VVFLEGDTDVLPLWVFIRVTVVPYVTRLCSEDAVIAAEFAVLAGEPRRASLPEDDVSWDNILSCYVVSYALSYFLGRSNIPPLFFAPRRLPGPSLAPLARPWA
jgi:hypothetical protein